MAAYNRINGDYAGANAELLQGVLKGTWGYPGWVMSDWGATRGWEYATAGLDQECGAQLDAAQFGAEAFGAPLQAAFARGEFSPERLSEMVCRILRSMYAVGVDAWGPAPTVDAAAHAAIALETARQGIVLLKNDGLLPLRRGGRADGARRTADRGSRSSVATRTSASSRGSAPPRSHPRAASRWR